MKSILDLRQSEHSYFLGLLQTDGHIEEATRNRSKVKLELNRRDRSILSRLRDVLPVKSSLSDRNRVTNFGPSSTSTITIFNRAFTDEMKSYGVPAGRKSEVVTCPCCEYSAVDYWRGVADGDGSLGITAKGFPFISLVTKSEGLAVGFISLIKMVTGQNKHTGRNRRDKVFNISLFKEHAQTLISHLYYPGAFCINRKGESAKEALLWTRPETMRAAYSKKSWTEYEDEAVRSMRPEAAAIYLGRTLQSIRTRRWRIGASILNAA